MFGPNNASAVATPPARVNTGPSGFFGAGDPATGTLPTLLDADFMNMLLEELLAILAAAGIAPSAAQTNQLLQAIEVVVQVVGDTRYVQPGGVTGFLKKSGDTMTGQLTLAPVASGGGYTNIVALQPTDYGPGKPGLFISKAAASSLRWTLAVADPNGVAGELDLSAGIVTVPTMPRGTGGGDVASCGYADDSAANQAGLALSQANATAAQGLAQKLNLAGGTLTGQLAIAPTPAGAGFTNVLVLQPTDYGVGKPGLFISKQAGSSLKWSLGLADPNGPAGELDLTAGLITVPTQPQGTGGTAVASCGYADSSAAQAASGKLNRSGDTATGLSVPTPPPGDNSLAAVNSAFVYAALAALVNGETGVLATIHGIAAALNQDSNFANDVLAAIATKLGLTGGTLTGQLTVQPTPFASGFANLLQLGPSDFGVGRAALFFSRVNANANDFRVATADPNGVLGTLDLLASRVTVPTMPRGTGGTPVASCGYADDSAGYQAGLALNQANSTAAQGDAATLSAAKAAAAAVLPFRQLYSTTITSSVPSVSFTFPAKTYNELLLIQIGLQVGGNSTFSYQYDIQRGSDGAWSNASSRSASTANGGSIAVSAQTFNPDGAILMENISGDRGFFSGGPGLLTIPDIGFWGASNSQSGNTGPTRHDGGLSGIRIVGSSNFVAGSVSLFVR